MKKTATGKTRLQTQAVCALLVSRTIQAAAESCGISSRTLLNWLAEPKFQEKYRSAKNELLEGAVNQLRSAGFDAVHRLHKVVADTDAPLTAAVSAAARLLELLLKSVEIQDLAERLDRLEASMKGDQ